MFPNPVLNTSYDSTTCNGLGFDSNEQKSPVSINGYQYTRLVDHSPSVCSGSIDKTESQTKQEEAVGKQKFCNISMNDDQKLPFDGKTFEKSAPTQKQPLKSALSQASVNHQQQQFGSLQIESETDEQIISDDHVKYAALITYMFFWCFPFTGVPAVVYARLMRQAYALKDIPKAREYLKKTENLLMCTFFFGITLISIIFAILQNVYFPISGSVTRHNGTTVVTAPVVMPH